jgi:hypothetical protein
MSAAVVGVDLESRRQALRRPRRGGALDVFVNTLIDRFGVTLSPHVENERAGVA